MAKSLVKVMDNWEWTEDVDEADRPTTYYFTGMSHICNLWRSPGNQRRVYQAARTLEQAGVLPADASQLFKNAPGRCLRGRWLSLDAIERRLRTIILMIGQVFRHLWMAQVEAAAAKRQARRRRRDPGAEEDEQYQENARQMKFHGTKMSQCRLFLGMIIISTVCKSPLCHYMLWLQKETDIHNKEEKAAKLNGRQYLGQTPLSKLVATKALELRGEMTALFDGEADLDAFGPVWLLVPELHRNCARQLIATMILNLLTAWDFRVLKRLRQAQYQFLLIVESNPDDDDVRRRELAGYLLDPLLRQFETENFLTDFPLKIRDIFREELIVMRDNGTCPSNLFAFALMFRCRMPYQNQCLEGMISVVQRMAKLAHNSHKPIISDRLRNRFADDVDIAMCSQFHDAVAAFEDSEENERRWDPHLGAAPRERIPPVLHDAVNDLSRRFDNGFRTRWAESGLAFTWSFKKVDEHANPVEAIEAFLISWSYGPRLFVAHGRIRRTGAHIYRFSFDHNYPTEMLKDVFRREMLKRPNPLAAAQFIMSCYPTTWDILRTPLVHIDRLERVAVRPSQSRPRAARPDDAPPPDGAPNGALQPLEDGAPDGAPADGQPPGQPGPDPFANEEFARLLFEDFVHSS